MAELMTVVTSHRGQLRSSAMRRCEPARRLWIEALPRTRTVVQMGALLSVPIIAYSYSLTTLVQVADLNSPLAYVSLVPVIALILAAVNRNPSQPEPAIHDRQTDYIVGVPLMAAALCANLFLPSKLSAMFWVWRIDLLTMPFFVAGAVAVIFGIRVLWRQKVAVAVPLPGVAVSLHLRPPRCAERLHDRNVVGDRPAAACRACRNAASRRVEQCCVHRGPPRTSFYAQCDLGVFGGEQRRRISAHRDRLRGRNPWALGPKTLVAGRGHAFALGAEPGADHPGVLGGQAIRRAFRDRCAPALHRACAVRTRYRRHDAVHSASGLRIG